MNMFEDNLWIIALIASVITLLQLPFTLSGYRQFLNKKLSNYNHKEKIILLTSIPSLGLAVVLGVLAIAQFVNSIPTLFYIQTLPATSMNYAFQDLMLIGVVSGVICSFLGYSLFRKNLKELRIILSSKPNQDDKSN